LYWVVQQLLSLSLFILFECVQTSH
jgi:hypothetical protein